MNETKQEPREALGTLVRAAYHSSEANAIMAAADAYAADEVASALEIGRRIEGAPGEGQWQVICFFGHTEYTGWVTKITQHGQPAYRIDLPEKIFGGNPLAYRTHAASSWFSDWPVTEESVRAAWEAQRERAARRAREEAEWRTQDQVRALEAGDGRELAYAEDAEADEITAEDDPEAQERAEFMADAASLDTDFKENR